jgi:Cof subfamily protein (haloacid dehalogenase superfamily)
MELVVFDLDGTLLNKQQRLSPFTIEVLKALDDRGIHYTVATGRTHLAAQSCIADHDFPNWLICKNGVEWWHPQEKYYRHQGILTPAEINSTLAAFTEADVTPFVFCLDQHGQQTAYYSRLVNSQAEHIYAELKAHPELKLAPLSALPEQAQIINLSALGPKPALDHIVSHCHGLPHLSAYSGGGIYHPDIYWLDIHHRQACKGSSIQQLQQELGASNIIVFGDGDNDLPMFQIANEAYAMENADDHVKQASHEIIGHHDEDGVAKFLVQRFSL